MKLFINAINLSSAGGLNVTLNFLERLTDYQPGDLEVYVAAPSNCGYEPLASANMQFVWLPDGPNVWVSRVYIDYVWIPDLLKKIRPDAVFTMGNFATPTALPQVLLTQYPHPAYPNQRDVTDRLDWLEAVNVSVRNAVFGMRLKYVDVLLVQTETMRSRIRHVYPSLPAVELLPNAYTQLSHQTAYKLPRSKEPGIRYLLCLSRYYSHKNIEVLVDVAQQIAHREMPYRILLTIESEQHYKARWLLRRIQKERLDSVIYTIGNVPTTSIAALYTQVDGLVLPTLLESFSGTYVDAMHFGVPIFTSRRDFAEEVCGDCAYYFNPLSAEDILSTIDAGFKDNEQLLAKLKKGRLQSAKMPDWTTVTQMGLNAIESLLNNVSTPVSSHTYA
ncbi:glycosyltransferase [Spirosoma soli]|uniref:Glycosyltransferase n=1 Tax=Spirosoma soli TaxID=1770529 RepID=A0ABW5MAM1_9BACT